MSDELTVAVGQFGGSPYWEDNLKICIDYLDDAARNGVDLLVLPEGSFRTRIDGVVSSEPQPLDGPFIADLVQRSSESDVCVIVGTLESTADPRPSNTVVAIRRGEILAIYRKLHLYDAFTGNESDRIQPGEEPLDCFNLDGFRVGMMTCYDVRFPEVARLLAVSGADMIAVPAAWVPGPLKEMHWQVMCTARALENTCYVVASGKAGPTRIGGSMIIDPLGVHLAQLGPDDGSASAKVSRAVLDSVRTRLPLLEQRRFRVDPQPIAATELAKLDARLRIPEGSGDADEL